MLFAPGLTILMYHSIADNSKDPHAIHPDVFAQQMESLASNSRMVIPLHRAIVELGSVRSLAPRVAVTFDDAYADFLQTAAPMLAKAEIPATLFVPTRLVGQSATWDTYDTCKRLMTWQQLKEAQDMGFEFGSHTLTHRILPACDDELLREELVLSMAELRSRLDKVVPILSYPAGRFGDREIRAVRAAGYSAAVSTASRWRNYPWSNRFSLRRHRWHE